MRTLLLTLAVLLSAVVVVVACVSIPTPEPTATERPPSAPGGFAFDSPIETPIPGATATPGQILPPVVIDLALSTPIMVNQPVTLTISIQANMEILDPAFGFGLKTESAGYLEVYTMTLPSLAQNEVRQVSQTLRMPGKEGRYSIAAHLTPRKLGGTYSQALYFAVSGDNVVFNPTPGPAVAATVEVIGRPTSLPTRTPQAPVTTVPEVTSTPEAGASSSALPVNAKNETADATSTELAQAQQTITISGRLRIPARPHLLGAPDPMPSRYTKVSVYNLNDLSTPPGDTTYGNPPD